MEIQYFGNSCFRIKGKQATLITDPFDPQKVGYNFPKTTADIITISHQHEDHNDWSQIKTADHRTEPFVAEGPGEYEISGVSLFGIPSFHDNVSGKKFGKNTIFVLIIDGVRLVHLGDLGHKLDSAQLEQVDGVDVLLIPVGGTYTLDARSAAEVVAQINPSIVIPMHYKSPGLNIELDSVEEFLKEMGREEIKPIPRLLIKEKPPEEQEVVILARR